MPIPWLGLLDLALGLGNMARGQKRAAADAEGGPLTTTGGRGGPLDARIAGVMVAALKEVFDRDSHRLELEREQMEAERLRAERAMRLEQLRQAGEREIGRLRLVAGIAVAAWLGTLFFAARMVAGGSGARIAFGAGWVLLLAALALSFSAQTAVSKALDRTDELIARRDALEAGLGGAIAPWLLIAGLAVIAAAVLIA
jgi:hypothetical protein